MHARVAAVVLLALTSTRSAMVGDLTAATTAGDGPAVDFATVGPTTMPCRSNAAAKKVAAALAGSVLRLFESALSRPLSADSASTGETSSGAPSAIFA